MTAVMVPSPGTTVTIKGSDGIKGVINRAVIHTDHSITYNVVWWNGRARQEEFMTIKDFEVDHYEETRIGFTV